MSRARTLSPHSCTNPDDSIPAPSGLKRRYLPLGTFLSAWTRIDDDHPCLAMDRAGLFETTQAGFSTRFFHGFFLLIFDGFLYCCPSLLRCASVLWTQQ